MYDSLLSSIIWYATWPILIIVSSLLIRLGLRYFEAKRIKDEKLNTPTQS